VELFAVPGIDAATHGNGVRPVASPTQNYLPPVTVRRILIVGAGGFGREVLHWARAAWPDHASLIAGFLSADASLLSEKDSWPPVVADPAAFEPRPGDALLLAIGIPGVRRRVAEDLLACGAEFLTLVHPSAIVCDSATIGAGSILCPGAIVSDSARLGRFCLVNYHASLAHDAAAGDFAVLSPYATLAGGASVAADVFLGLHASVGPGVSVGLRSKVAANSCALADVPADALVHGVPGRISPLLVT
jgi:sugar O-acyltransferase (sialic acid O-acetyltransferase NeuD family)